MRTKLKKYLSILLTLVMLVGMLPTMAFAASAQPGLSIVLTKTNGETDSIIIDNEGNLSTTSGDNWTYDKVANKLTLNDWSGQKISANGAFNLHLVGENTITMKDENNASGIQISSITQADINVTAAAGGKLTINSPDSGLTNSYKAVSFPNISGQFAGTLNIKSGEVAINITSSYGADYLSNPIGYGVAGKVAFADKEDSLAKLTVALSSTTENKGALQGLSNLDVNNVTGAEISVNVSATSKDVKATAISGFKAENSGAKVTATAMNTDTNTPALNKLAIGSANKISLATGGKITANGCVLVPYSVWNGGYFIDVIYGKTKTTTPENNSYLIIKGNGYYDPAVMSDTTTKQPLTTVVIEPADAVPTLTWLGGDITIPERKVNESIDKYSFYPYLRGISAYDNLSVNVTSGSLPKGLSYHKGRGISGTPTEVCNAGIATITFKDNMGTSDINDDRTVDITVNYGAVDEADKFITVGNTTFVTTSNKTEANWSWNATDKKLTLTNYNGGPIKSDIGFNLHLSGENTITMKNESGASGIQISSTTKADINVTADTNGKLTIKSPEGGLTNSYYAVLFPNLSGQFAGTLNIKSGEIVVDVTSSSATGYGVAGDVKFENTGTVKLNVSLSSTNTTATNGDLTGLRNLDVSNVTGAEISVNVSAASKDVTATAIYVLRATDSGAVVTATAANSASGTPALNKQAIGSANPISLAAGGKITANGCVLVPYSVWNGSFIDVIYGKTKTTTPDNNSYLLVKGSGVYPSAVMSNTTTKQPLTTVVIEPATEVPTLTWLGGEITIPEGKVNQSIDEYSFYPYLRGVSAYDNLSVSVTSGNLPVGLSYSKSRGIYGTPTTTCAAGTATITFKDSMGTTDTNDDRTKNITVNYGAVTWPKPVTGVSVTPTAVTVGINGTAPVTGSVSPTEASYANLDVATSSNSAVATASVGEPNENGQSTITVTGHSTGTATITVKSKENPGYTASITVNVKEATPSAGIDYVTEELNNLVPSAKYLIDGKEHTANTDGRIAIASDFLDKTLGIIKVNESAVMNSCAQSLDVPGRKAGPTGLTTNKASSSTAADGAIRGGSTEMEYRRAGTNDAWTQIHSTSTAVAAGSYEVRYRATDDSFASEPATVTVGYNTPGGNTGGGGGAIAPTSFSIATDNTENGTVSVSTKSASKGDIVTITVAADKGYKLDKLTATDSSNKQIKLTEKDGKYSFEMPESNVTVKASFTRLTAVNPFIDVTVGDYFYEAVMWAVENNITKGTSDTTFSPSEPCTRAQIVTFLWRASGSPEPKSAASFADVSSGSYYAKAVAWAVENGITSGTGEGKFSPDDVCTRAQAVTFLSRALKGKATAGSTFSDVEANSYYAEAVAWAAENGITSGTSAATFSPDEDCTRGQIVTFLFRAMAE